MILGVTCVMLACASGMLAAAAHAEPALPNLDNTRAIEYAGPDAVQLAQGVRGRDCRIAVSVRGAVATVETRERFVNATARPLAVRTRLAIPASGVLVAASLTLDGIALPAIAVPPTFATTGVDDPAVIGADPLLVQAAAGGLYATIQPTAVNREAVLTTRYVEVAEPVAGGLRVVLPGREGGLASECRAQLTVEPGPGARAVFDAREVRVRAAPVPLDIRLDLAGAAPVVWTQSAPIAPDWRASLITVLAPHLPPPPAPDRVLFVVDGSRSMTLIGSAYARRIIQHIADAAPAAAFDAIVYDRSAARVLGEFRAGPAALPAIAAAVERHPAGNGSDLAAAFALAHQALAGAPGTSRIVVLSDGVIDADGAALVRALDLPAAAVDVHAVILDPGHTRPTGLAALQAAIFHAGGSVIAIDTDAAVDDALAHSDDWFRPAALELAIAPAVAGALAPELRIPADVRAGRGFSRLVFHRDPLPALVVTGHSELASAGHVVDKPFRVSARAAPAAPIAALASAAASVESFAGDDNPNAGALAAAERSLAALRAAHPVADAHHAFAVLSRTGRIAGSRRAVVAGGGSYQRIVAIADLPRPPELVPPGPTASIAGYVPPSAIDKLTLERLFRDQLSPRAYACFQRALVRSPHLAGTAVFDFHIGRGEVSSVTLAGFGDPTFDACLLDAAYAIQPPLPNFAVQVDDQTLVHYPLSFTVHDDHPLIMAGDADSSSPLDIDAIQGGVPARRKPVRVQPATPLGGLPKP